MIIRMLVYSEDTSYAIRLKDILSKTNLATGDSLEISLFTDKSKLEREKITSRYHIALIDENIVPTVKDCASIIMILTDNDSLDNIPYENFPHTVWIYKYQRVSAMLDKFLMVYAKRFGGKAISNAVVCAFYSQVGGSGTSTIASAFAIAAAGAGINPLYVSFEHFNSTDVFFKDLYGKSGGLSDIFRIITEHGMVGAGVDTIKTRDNTGVNFIKKFKLLEEVSQITPDEIETFISGARTANEVDLLVIDLGSGFNYFNDKVFECADEIFLVTDSHGVSNFKLEMFFKETHFANFSDKINIVFNKTQIHNVQNTNYRCKSTIRVPSFLNTDNALFQIENILRGTIKEEWKPKVNQ
ncbi:MAG: hypothetical protein FWF57_05255 [Defluviitaleaceae bacterium]|nr:hypothetical protein [Defluviitaleaceae bacterium]